MSEADDSRANMTSRLDTARRAHADVGAVLSKAPENDPVAAQRDDDLVRDRFRSLLSELNNVRQYFGKWWGKERSGVSSRKRLDRWRDARLASDDERRIWNEIRAARDADVHREPVPSGREAQHYVFGFGGAGAAIVVSTRPYVARFTDDDGAAHVVQLQMFCPSAISVTEKFVAEFDGNY